MALSVHRSETLSQALRIYLSHALASAREILRQVEEEEEYLASDDGPYWNGAVKSAKLVVHFTECCINDEREGRMLCSGLIGLAVLSRAEESLRSALQAAKCTWGFGRAPLLQLSQVLHQGASFYTEALIAARAKESELSALYQSAGEVCDYLVQMNDCCVIICPGMPGWSLVGLREYIAQYKKVAAEDASSQEAECLKLVVISCRTAHACEYLHQLHSRNWSCFPRGGDRMIRIFERKWVIAQKLTECYHEAATIASRARKEEGRSAAAAVYEKALSLALQAAGTIRNDFVGTLEEPWTGAATRRVLQIAEHLADVADDLSEAAFALAAVSTSSAAASSPVVAEAAAKLSLLVTKCAEAAVALDLSPSAFPVGTNIHDLLPPGVDSLANTATELKEVAPRLAFYLRKAAAVDTSLSPAHARIAVSWQRAAFHATREIAAMGELGDDPIHEQRLEVYRLCRELYIQLATGMMGDAAEMFLNAARDAGKPWGEQWGRAADLMLGAGEGVEAALQEQLMRNHIDTDFQVPTESIIIAEESRACAQAALAAARQASLGSSGTQLGGRSPKNTSYYMSELELAYSRLFSGIMRPAKGCSNRLKDYGFNAKRLISSVKALLAQAAAHPEVAPSQSSSAPQGETAHPGDVSGTRYVHWVAEHALVVVKSVVLLYQRALPEEPGLRLVRLLHCEILNALASFSNQPTGYNSAGLGGGPCWVEDDWEVRSVGEIDDSDDEENDDDDEEVPLGALGSGVEAGAAGVGTELSEDDDDAVEEEEGAMAESYGDGSSSGSEDGDGDSWGESDDVLDEDSSDDGKEEQKQKTASPPVRTTTSKAQSMEAARLLVLALEACGAGDALAARLFEMAARCMSFYYAKQPFAVQMYLANQVERKAHSARTIAVVDAPPPELTAEEAVLIEGNRATLNAVVDALVNTAECRLKASQQQQATEDATELVVHQFWTEAASDYLTSADERLDENMKPPGAAPEVATRRSERLTSERNTRPERTLIAAQSYRRAAEAADRGHVDESQCWAKVARLLAICGASEKDGTPEENAQLMRDIAAKAATRFRKAAESLAAEKESNGGGGAVVAGSASRWLEAAHATESLLSIVDNQTIFITVSETHSKDTAALADYLASAAEAFDADTSVSVSGSTVEEREGRRALWTEIVAQQKEVIRYQREAVKLQGAKNRTKGVAQLQSSEADARRNVERLLRKLGPSFRRGGGGKLPL